MRIEGKGCEEKMNYSNILEHEIKCPKNPNKKQSTRPPQQIQTIGNISHKYSNQNNNNDFSLK